MLRDQLIQHLKSNFETKSFTFFEEGRRIASITMPNGQGDLLIIDDGDEITFFLGEITHYHFSQEYLGQGKYSSETETIKESVDFLCDLFSDRVILYRNINGGRDGSIQCPSEEQTARVMAECDCFVWSKQLK